MSLPPTGGQVVLRSGDAEATAVEVGGGLRTYRVGDRDVLDREVLVLRSSKQVGKPAPVESWR